MDEELIRRIDGLIDGDAAALTADTIRLVNIPSVRGEAVPGAPFGAGPRRVLDEVLRMAAERGFVGKEYGSGVISVAAEDGTPDLGIWAHGDVVPVGDGWLYEPFNATEYRGCVIGRGATDNKGQLVCILHLLTMFRDLGVRLRYLPALYVGSCEETGMLDLRGLEGNPDAPGYLNTCTPPRLSLVPDGSFPIGCSGKGILSVEIEGRAPLHGLTIEAGHPETPGRAVAVLERTDCPELKGCTVERGERVKITTETPPVHAAHPDPNGNMITVLTRTLTEHGLCAPEDVRTLGFLRELSRDTHGFLLGIDHVDEATGETTVAALELTMNDGRPRMKFKIRYPMGLTPEGMLEAIAAHGAEYGFDVVASEIGIRPYVRDKNGEIPQTLRDIANAVTGENKEIYNVGGGAYSHLLPNGYLFGMDGNQTPDDFPKGHGAAHGIDESVSIFRLQRAMRIYARALLALNEMSW